MPIDAQIPLQVQPLKIPSAMEVMSLRDLATRSQINQVSLEEKKMELGKRNALLQLMQDPQVSDKATGRITPEGLARISQIDPEKGIQLAHQQQTLSLQDMAVNEKKDVVRKHIGTAYVTSYQNALQTTGGNTQEAEKIARQDALAAIEAGWSSGSFKAQGITESEYEKMKQLPPPEQMRSLVTAMGGKIEPPTPKTKETRKLDYQGPNGVTYQKQQEFDPATRQWKDIPGTAVPRTGDVAEKGDTIPAEHAGLHGEDYIKTLPSGQQGIVKGLVEGRISPSSLSTRGGHREAMLSRATQYDPTYNAGLYQARAGVLKDFTSGKSAQNVTAINTAIGHMGTLSELNDALKNNDTQGINKIVNTIATQLGDPSVNNQQIAVSAVGNELMRVFRQVGASEVETKDWEAKFKAASSPAQLQGAVKVAAELLQSRIEALDDQYKRGMGTEKGYPKLLSDKSKATMSKIGGGKVQEFATEAEAAAANLPSGTKVKIGGKMGTWR